MSDTDYLEEPPQGAALTDYDRAHVKLYMRLMDAEADGANWREVVSVIFKIDPDANPDRAQHLHAAHLARARWITDRGYRQLLHGDQP